MNFYEVLEETEHTQIKKIVKDFLMNAKGRVEGQRISEKSFEKNGQNWELFEENNIKNSQDLYDFITKEDRYCSCGNPRRWKGLRDGYVKKCEQCSRKQNWISNVSESNKEDVSLDDILTYVKDSKGNYSTSRIKKLSDRTIEELKNSKPFITWNATIPEYLYCLEHNTNSLGDLPKCKHCNEPVTRFHTGTKGYWDYHQGECAKELRKEAIINNEATKQRLRRVRSSTIYTRMEVIPEGYERLKDFNKDVYLESGTDFIVLRCPEGHEYEINNHYQGSFRCGTCFPIRSKTQNDIYDFVKRYDLDVTDNNRKTIPNREIDILSEKYSFGIEYNSQNFHSSGNSDFLPSTDKNYHLEKTILAEDVGYHLFHIFSSEYLDSTKRNIWNSMLLNKLCKNKKIYARQCTIKEITSKELREFSELNHIQGHVNARVRIGLFYSDELIQIMSFSTPRQSKYKGTNNYELMRLCSKLGTSVIGGASKLLNYFKKVYNPELILSYANRRWTYKENVYKKLGFKLEGITKPNYFYFACCSDENILESRVKYQKHKLKNLPQTKDFYENELTETEIMFAAGYRKIYDSGNYIYVWKSEI